MIRLKVTPVVGLPQFTGWSQVAESTSSASTRLVSVFAISGKHAGNVGRDVADKISEFYYYDIEQLHEFIQSLILFTEENDCELFISAALINDGKSIFITRGGSVFLKRKEKLGQILSSEEGIKIVEGSYTESDVFVLTTFQASQFLNEIEQKFLQGFDVDIIITSVVPGLHAQTDSSLSAIVFINQPKLDDEESEETVSREPTLEADIDYDDLKSDQEITQDTSFPEKKIEISADLTDSGIDLQNAMEHVGKFKSVSGGVLTKFVLYLKSFLSFLVMLLKKILSVFRKINFRQAISSIKSLKDNGLKSIMSNKVSLNDKPKNKYFPRIIISIVLVSVIVGVASYVVIGHRREEARVVELLNPVQEQISIARNELDIDPINSRDILSGAINTLESLKEENTDSSSINLIDEELTRANEFFVEISGKKELDELDIFYDLRLVKSDYVANDIDANGEKLVLLDSEERQVVSLDIGSKQVTARDFSANEGVIDLAMNENTAFVLTDGIQSFELEEDSEIEEVRGLGDSNRNATFVAAYDRFVYVLSPDKRNLYRYSQEEDGYSDPIGWMRSATGLKYDEVTSVSVDGDVWITTTDGQIKKFAGGVEEEFSLRGLNNGFSNSIKLYTNIDQENLYVLESDNNRIVVLSKAGEFIKEIKSISLAAVGSIAANEELGKIFAVSGSIVYEININE